MFLISVESEGHLGHLNLVPPWGTTAITFFHRPRWRGEGDCRREGRVTELDHLRGGRTRGGRKRGVCRVARTYTPQRSEEEDTLIVEVEPSSEIGSREVT